MNTVTALCGHSVIAVGAPGSQARMDCELGLCNVCQTAIHCGEHYSYVSQCHWCNVAKLGWLKMTTQERMELGGR